MTSKTDSVIVWILLFAGYAVKNNSSSICKVC